MRGRSRRNKKKEEKVDEEEEKRGEYRVNKNRQLTTNTIWGS